MLKDSEKILILIFITIIAKLLGFVREIAIASVFGTTTYTDAYLIATTIPLVIFLSLSEAISTTIIPMYSSIMEKKNKDEALKFINKILNMLVLITIILCIFGMFFSRSLVSLFAIGFKGETFELAVTFTKILLPGIILIGINYVLSAFLQANKNFYVMGFIAFPKNIVIILSSILSYFWDKSILVYGTLFGIAGQLFYQLHFALKNGYTYKFEKKLVDKDIKQFGYLIIPIILGMTVQQLNVLIDKTLASTLVEGSIAALDFAYKLDLFVFGVFTAPVVMVVFTMISQLAAKDDWKAFNDTIEKSIRYMLLILIPVSIGAMCLCTPVVKVLFQRGHFDERATQITSIALFYYSLEMTGSGLRIILSKAFYSLRDTKTPMMNGFIAIIINIILNMILIKPLGHGGLALATSISSLIGAILLFLSLEAKTHSFSVGKIAILVVKLSMSSLFMAIGVKVSYTLLSQILGNGFFREIVSLFSCIFLGALIYFVSIILMKVEEVNILFIYLKSKINIIYFIKNKMNILKKLIFNSKISNRTMNSRKQLKLLLGVSSPIEDESSEIVYQLISSLPIEKYYITLAATEDSIIVDKIKKFNENSSSKVNIMVIPPLKEGASLLYNLKIFYIIYKIMLNIKFDIVHFHSFKLGLLGCVAAWMLKVPKIFFTVHGWPINENKTFAFCQRLIDRVATNIICVSNFDLNKGIRNKWLYAKNTHLIYYGIEKHIFRTRTLKRQLKINKNVPIVGMITNLDDFGDIAYIINIFNELKKRKNMFRLIIIVNGSQLHKCKIHIHELGLSSYVHVLHDCKDASQWVDDFDIFSYFSNKEKIAIEVIKAMFAQKPIITNDIGVMSELVEEGKNGYISKERDIETAVKNIENLLKSYHLRKTMGEKSKAMAYRKFSKEKMINEHELLYFGFNIYSDEITN